MTEVLSSWFGKKKPKASVEPQSTFKSHIKESLPEVDGFVLVKNNEVEPSFKNKSDYESLYSFVHTSGRMGGAASTVENNGIIAQQPGEAAPPLYPALPTPTATPYPLMPFPNWNPTANIQDPAATSQPTPNTVNPDAQGANYFLSNVPFKLSSFLENRTMLNDNLLNKDGFLAMKLELINTLEYDFKLEHEVLKESDTLLTSS